MPRSFHNLFFLFSPANMSNIFIQAFPTIFMFAPSAFCFWTMSLNVRANSPLCVGGQNITASYIQWSLYNDALLLLFFPLQSLWYPLGLHRGQVPSFPLTTCFSYFSTHLFIISIFILCPYPLSINLSLNSLSLYFLIWYCYYLRFSPPLAQDMISLFCEAGIIMKTLPFIHNTNFIITCTIWEIQRLNTKHTIRTKNTEAMDTKVMHNIKLMD